MMTALSATRVLSIACGLMMAAAAAGTGTHMAAVVLAVLAGVAVAAGTVYLPAATVAVLLAAASLVLSNPAPTWAAVSGLSAAAYLVLRHAAGTRAGLDIVSVPTVVAAVGFTFAGLAATAFSVQLPWLPLAAPPAVFAIYALAMWPFAGDREGSES
jgi:hypothetical protein